MSRHASRQNAQTLFPDDRPQEEAPAGPVPEMKVLGTLRVDGLDGRFPLRRCTELVTSLTFHRHGVEADTSWKRSGPNNHRTINA
ncbi:MAG TPA: hypothetical protein VGA97_10375 [Acidimicrobiia bacterium]